MLESYFALIVDSRGLGELSSAEQRHQPAMAVTTADWSGFLSRYRYTWTGGARVRDDVLDKTARRALVAS